MDRLRTLIGISVFWFGLAMLGDGFTTLVVPVRLAGLVEPAVLATVLGLVTFVGLLAGALVQPIAGAASDALYPRWGRRGMLVVGAALVVGALGAFVGASSVVAILLAFVLLQLAAGVAQAAQQGFIPDLVASDWRGRAAGAKGLADLGGAFVGFAVLGLLLAGGGFAAGMTIGRGTPAASASPSTDAPAAKRPYLPRRVRRKTMQCLTSRPIPWFTLLQSSTAPESTVLVSRSS